MFDLQGVCQHGQYVRNGSIKYPKPHAYLHSKEVYIILNGSDERCRRNCGDKIMVGKG